MLFKIPPIIKCDYELKNNDGTEFIFPITGLIISGNLTVGNVIFYNNKNSDFDNEKNMKVFQEKLSVFSKVRTIAYVNINGVSNKWKKECNNNLSISLMLLKQAIGLLYLTYFEYKGFNDSKRIIISENNTHECEEGMGTFLYDGKIVKSNVSDNLWLKPDDDFYFILNKRMNDFLNLYKMDSEMKFKTIKMFESLYYLLNEIHSMERILKMSAFLQMVFLKHKNEEFQNVAKRIKILLNMENVEINYLGNDGKINEILRDIYINVRNAYSHGSIDLYNEFNVIKGTDYFIFYQAYMNIIILLSYNEEFQDIQTTEDLRIKIENYRP